MAGDRTKAVYINDSRIKAGKKDQIIAQENRLKLGKNGCFDITLIKRAGDGYVAEIYMKLQFFFVDGDKNAKGWPNDKAYVWTQEEKNKFLKNWHTHIKTTWSKSNIGKLSDGKPLSIVVNVTAQQGGWMWDHFEIDVTKIPPAPDSFRQSFVQTRFLDADVELDSKDLKPKASGQLAAVHEFGHMLGLPDEYHKKSPYFHDAGSIMNTGTTVKKRHFDEIIKWANKQLKS